MSEAEWVPRKHYPSPLDEMVEKQKRRGIWYRRRKGGQPLTRRLEVDEIHWKPGDPNALADAIIKHVHRPLLLDLNGHRYTITPQGGQDG